MSFIVKLFVFAMLVAMVMAQLPDMSAIPIPAGIIPEGVIPPGVPGGAAGGAEGAEGGEEAASRDYTQKMF